MKNNIKNLENIIAKLRSDDGCPWDKDLSLQKLGKLTIEESYELFDAVEKGQNDHIIDELADLLTHLFFYFQIGETSNNFTKEEVISRAKEKLISRHPHVFDKNNKKDLKTAEDVEKNWSKLKSNDTKFVDNLNFVGPSSIAIERVIKKIIDLNLDFEMEDYLKNDFSSNDLFLIYYKYLSKGLSPEIKLREKINYLSKKISDRQKELNIAFEDFDKDEIIKILFNG
tara:strand:+ start:39 stop:719 length:681 start_codon:yes stop_codon:yes gene_type:complete